MHDNRKLPAPSRRTALVLLAAGAAAAVPSGATAMRSNPDRELIELGRRYWECSREVVDADKLYEELAASTEYPDPPEALCRRKADAKLFRHAPYWLDRPSVDIGEPYESKEVNRLASHKAMRTREIGDINSPDFRVVREPWPLAQARADVIVAAHAEWDRQIAAVDDECGITAALARIEHGVAEYRDLAKKIAATPATTLAGIRVRVEILAEIFEGEPMNPDACTDELMTKSIMRDVLRMTAATA